MPEKSPALWSVHGWPDAHSPVAVDVGDGYSVPEIGAHLENIRVQHIVPGAKLMIQAIRSHLFFPKTDL